MSLEVLVKNSPKDKHLAIEFAEALSASGGDTRQGERILAELLRNSPNDGELNQALKNLSARQTMDEGGYSKLEGGQGSYRDILKDKKEAVSLEQEKRVVKTEDTTERLIGEYEARLQTEPKNLKLVRSLAELYTQKNQFDRPWNFSAASRIPTWAATRHSNAPWPTPSCASTNFNWSNSIPPRPITRNSRPKSRLIKLNFQITECQQRVEKYPTDLAIRFEMGQLYFQAGKITEAVLEFQKAQGNPHKRLAAMNYLAQCYAKRKMYDMAARQLQNAIKEKPVFDDEKKEMIYNLGCVLESMGKKEEAVEQFKLIYEMDIGYKDVAAKVDAFYAGQ